MPGPRTPDAQGRIRPPDDAGELLARYAAGERKFARAALSGEYLDGADLRHANLSQAHLIGAYLHEANLKKVNLCGAFVSRADLTRASLYGSNLSHADLCRADLGGADLSGADLCHANFSGANLAGANLSGAMLADANLRNADLRYANLSGANLDGANLHGANLGGARLNEARFDSTSIGRTVLSDVDLSAFCDAEPPIVHEAVSDVDFRSIAKSLRSPKLKAFLQRTGMPEVFVEYNISCAESLDGSIIKKMLQSTFISYGGPDEPLARKLYEALHRNGVTTFLFAEHAVPGDKLHRMMRRGVNEYDRVILVCSKASINRKGVQSEIEETLAREHRDGSDYLIPIRLDDYVLTDWAPKSPDLAQTLRDRVVADFRGADKDEEKFQAGLRRLIAALRK